MSRELIYRVWDPTFNRIIGPDDMAMSMDALENIAKDHEHDSLTGVEGLHIHVFELLNDMHTQGGYIYMQYSGLEDKAGKMIFEGDIINYRTQNAYGEVVFKYGMFCVFKPGDEDTPDGYMLIGGNRYNPQEVKVMGNKYENPELLKEEV